MTQTLEQIASEKEVTVDQILPLDVRILNWTQTLCICLQDQYRSVYPDSFMDKKFVIVKGNRYYKIVMEDLDDEGNTYSSSVHAFVDKKTGEVYKPASWKSPAKHVRYDMRIIRDREFLHNPANVGWAGGYLYMR